MTIWTIDKDALRQGEMHLNQAFRVLLLGTHPDGHAALPKDCLSCRAQIAIRHVAGLLFEQAGHTDWTQI